MKMLKDYGVKIDKSDHLGLSSSANPSNIPNQNDLPSTWNIEYKRQALQIAEAVILKWNEKLLFNDKEFVIFYVPRESQWRKKDELQDSWKEWLKNLCEREDIYFVDPVKNFLIADSFDKKIYDDHFSEDGHIAFSNSFLQFFSDFKNISLRAQKKQFSEKSE